MADDGTIRVGTELDASGIVDGGEQIVAEQKKTLDKLRDQYTTVTDAIKAQTKSWAFAEKEATVAMAAGHTAMAASLRAAADGEKASMDGLIALQQRVKVSIGDMAASQQAAQAIYAKEAVAVAAAARQWEQYVIAVHMAAEAERIEAEEVERTAAAAQHAADAHQNFGFSARYAFLGIKDIAEGRYVFALAELSNELIKMGGAAMAIGGVAAVVVGLGYAIYKATDYFTGWSAAVKEAEALSKTFPEAMKKATEELKRLEDQKFGREQGQAALAAKQAGDLELNEIKKKDQLIATYERMREDDRAKTAKLRAAHPDLKAMYDAVDVGGKEEVNRKFGFMTGDINPYMKEYEAAALVIQSDDKRIALASKERAEMQAKTGQLSVTSLEKQQEANKKLEASELAVTVATIHAAEAEALRNAKAQESAVTANIKATQEQKITKIEAIPDAHNRTLAMAEAEVAASAARFAQLKPIIEKERDAKIAAIRQIADAEKASKDTTLERQAIEIKAEQDIASEKATAAEKIGALARAAVDDAEKNARTRAAVEREVWQEGAEDARKFFDTTDKLWKEALARGQVYIAKEADAQVKAAQIQAQAASAGRLGDIATQKVGVERTYDMQGSHTVAEQIAQTQKLQALDRAAREEKIAAAKKEQADMATDTQEEINKKTEAGNKIVEMERQNDLKIKQDENQILQMRVQQYKQYFDQIAHAFTSGLNTWISGQKTFAQAMMQSWNNITMAIIQDIEEWAIKWIEEHLIMAALTALLGDSQDNALQNTKQTNMESAASTAAVSGGEMFAYMIPELGPAAVGPAMAAYGIGMAFAGATSLDVGTDYVPRDQMAMIHKGERVMPATDNAAIIKAMNGNGAGAGGGGMQIHAGAISIAPPAGVSASDVAQMVPRAIEAYVRRKNGVMPGQAFA